MLKKSLFSLFSLFFTLNIYCVKPKIDFFSFLADDVIFEILRKLPQTTRANFIKTNHRFFQYYRNRQVSLKPTTKLKIAKKYQKTLTDSQIIPEILKNNSLEEINLKDCENITNDTIYFIASLQQVCKNLRVINLSRCNNISPDAIINLLQNCPNLEKFCLKQYFYLNNDIIATLAFYCPKLKHLNISGGKLINVIENNSVTDEPLDLLTQNCPNLEKLNLSGLQYITDDLLDKMAINCQSLKVLKIYNTKLTLETVQDFIFTCTNKFETIKYQYYLQEHSCELEDGIRDAIIERFQKDKTNISN